MTAWQAAVAGSWIFFFVFFLGIETDSYNEPVVILVFVASLKPAVLKINIHGQHPLSPLRPKTGGDEFYANTEVLINRNMDISVYTLTLIGPTFSFAVWMLALVTTRHN